MTTTVQVDRGTGFEDIDYSDFKIEVGTSEVLVAPSARVTTQARETLSANLDARIQQDGTTIFEGVTGSAGTVRQNGQVRLPLEHPASALYAEKVDVTQTGTITERDVLDAALANSERGSNFTITYEATATTLDSDYEVENRSLTSVFRDMMDRTGQVWWIDPATTDITVAPPGNGGLWQSLDAANDGVVVRDFDEGSVGTVRNDVTVTATGGEAVSSTATDAGSISTYGRRSEDINIQYATTATEAQAVANELLIPDPLTSGTILVPQSVGTITEPLVNQVVDLTDNSKDISETDLVIEKQTIEQGRVTLKIGQGSAVNIANVNRDSKSQDDKSAKGQVFNSGNLADNSVDSNQLVDSSVIESKLDDLAVTLNKVAPEAIDTTKITDSAVETPKLAAGSVIADKIFSDTITANEIDSRTITALEIATDTLTANEIDTLDLNTGELSITTPAGDSALEFNTETAGVQEVVLLEPNNLVFIGTSSFPIFTLEVSSVTVHDAVLPDADNTNSVGVDGTSFNEMWAYNYFDANTDATINDGGDPLAGLADGHGPPEHAKARDDGDGADTGNSEGEWVGTDISELSHTLMDICREQQRVIEDQQTQIDDLEQRLTDLEQRVDDIGGGNA
jgi:hypothetical protein